MAKKRNILITGSRGLVGSSFISNIFNYDTHIMGDIIESRTSTLICPEHSKMEISKITDVKRYIEKYKPEAIINFAAHRNANTAEAQKGDQKGSAWKSNVIGVKNISLLSKLHGIYLIHISTDMVFSGFSYNRGPYDERSTPELDQNKLSWYGVTKRLGEEHVQTVKGSAIIRIANVTRPVYDPTLDYVGKILWLYDNYRLYPMFGDQVTTLTYIPHITDTILALLNKRSDGVYHVASNNLLTPFKLAKYMLRKMKLNNGPLKNATMSDYLSEKPNRYPQYGGLASGETQKKLGLKFSTWEQIVNKFIARVNKLRL